MKILRELAALLEGLDVPVESAASPEVAQNQYAVLTPLFDANSFFTSNLPNHETQEVRLSLYSIDNKGDLKRSLIEALLSEDFTITDRQHTNKGDSFYHCYNIDVAKIYPKG